MRKRRTEEERERERVYVCVCLCVLLLKVASEPLDSYANFSPINLELVSRDCITRLVCLTSGQHGVCVFVCVTDSQSKGGDDTVEE